MSEGKTRLLYIDDDDGLRQLARKTLGRRGYDVTLAESGQEGVTLAGQIRFDLIAVDHYMPVQDGLTTLKALHRLPDPPPIIYVTGSEETQIAVAALKAGAADYVVKSIGSDFFDLLTSAFDQALAQVRLRAEKAEAEDALLESNARLEALNARLETLLKEVNHRVANSLQLVAAFVHMQAGALPDDAARSALEDTQRRIEAIAQVHRRLYTSGDAETIDMQEYLGALVQELEDTWSTPASPRTLKLAADPIRLSPDKAVSVGVIVNELVSNACKYAYEPKVCGEIRVALQEQGDHTFLLRVEDDGCGLPAMNLVRGTGLGAKVVKAMAQSLQSAIDYAPDHAGVRATLVAAM